MCKYWIIVMAVTVVASFVMVCPATTEHSRKFSLYPIGVVEKEEGTTRIILDEQYRAGLLGLSDFSHVYVFYWFDRNDTPQKRSTLQVHPRGNKENPLRGVFATRSPARPNLIAMSLCKIISIKGSVIEVDRIDALNDTPVIDIKPYIPDNDAAESIRIPEWLKRILAENPDPE